MTRMVEYEEVEINRAGSDKLKISRVQKKKKKVRSTKMYRIHDVRG